MNFFLWNPVVQGVDGSKKTAAVNNATKLVQTEATIFSFVFSWQQRIKNLFAAIASFSRRSFPLKWFQFDSLLFSAHLFEAFTHFNYTFIFFYFYFYLCVYTSFIYLIFYVLLRLSIVVDVVKRTWTRWMYSNKKRDDINVRQELIFTGIIKSHWRISRDFNRHILFYCHWRPLTHLNRYTAQLYNISNRNPYFVFYIECSARATRQRQNISTRKISWRFLEWNDKEPIQSVCAQ